MSKPGTKKHAKYIAVIHVYIVADAAMLFIFNGAVYFKTEQKVNVNKQGKWYNVILGTSLLGVMCCHNFKPRSA